VNRLRSYRAIENVNQHDLGDLLGLSLQMVSAIESGRRSFAGSLEAIGYSDERMALPAMSAPLHRQRASTTVAARRRAQELLRLGGEVFRELRDQTPKAPQMSLERLQPPSTPGELEERAIDVRYALRHEDSGPIRNLTTAVEEAGVCIIPVVGLPGIDGISSWVEGVPVIGVSPAVPGDRFRLTLGHELAHLLMHTRKTDFSEGEANRFSGALLFPQTEFEAAMPEHPQLRDFIALKASWGVSVAALVYRAHELEYIDDRRYRALQIQMSKWRKSEPGQFEPAQGQLLNKLIEVNGGVREVATRLGVNLRHLSELVNWRHLRLA
jgi:Zn-dependent peptidase ImmA (M78 family)